MILFTCGAPFVLYSYTTTPPYVIRMTSFVEQQKQKILPHLALGFTSPQKSLPRLKLDRTRGQVVMFSIHRVHHPVVDLDRSWYFPLHFFSRPIECNEPWSRVRASLQIRKDFLILSVEKFKISVHKYISMRLPMSQATLPEPPDGHIIWVILRRLLLGVDDVFVVIDSHPRRHIRSGEARLRSGCPLHGSARMISSLGLHYPPTLPEFLRIVWIQCLVSVAYVS